MALTLGSITLFSIAYVVGSRRHRAAPAPVESPVNAPRYLNQEERLRLALLREQRPHPRAETIHL